MSILTCGVIAGPMFVIVALLQAFTRDGFDLKRHPFSVLSLGDLGWIQIANFVIAGVLFIACGWRFPHRRRRNRDPVGVG